MILYFYISYLYIVHGKHVQWLIRNTHCLLYNTIIIYVRQHDDMHKMTQINTICFRESSAVHTFSFKAAVKGRT